MEQQRKPVPGDLYCHFKGNLYEVLTLAIHSETEEEMVVYRQRYGEYKAYVRPLSMFLSEVDHEKYPEVKQKYRFELVSAGVAPVIEEPGFGLKVEKASEEELLAAREQEMAASGPQELLYRFLDADTMKEKLRILEDWKETPDDLTITNMAISVDTVVEEGSPEKRMEELIDCLRTMARFECTRLR